MACYRLQMLYGLQAHCQCNSQKIPSARTQSCLLCIACVLSTDRPPEVGLKILQGCMARGAMLPRLYRLCMPPIDLIC